MESPGACSMSLSIYLRTLGVLKMLKVFKTLSHLSLLILRGFKVLKTPWRLILLRHSLACLVFGMFTFCQTLDCNSGTLKSQSQRPHKIRSSNLNFLQHLVRYRS